MRPLEYDIYGVLMAYLHERQPSISPVYFVSTNQHIAHATQGLGGLVRRRIAAGP